MIRAFNFFCWFVLFSLLMLAVVIALTISLILLAMIAVLVFALIVWIGEFLFDHILLVVAFSFIAVGVFFAAYMTYLETQSKGEGSD